MSNRMTIKTCEFCGKTYEAKKCDSLYCTPTCRKYAYIGRERRRMRQPVTATYTSYKIIEVNEPPDNPPIENVFGIDIKSMIDKTLNDVLKRNGF